jgi:hypothetical protein
MAPRVYPCVCGFTCEMYPQMKAHRDGCLDWKARPDPVSLMVQRRRRTREERTEGIRDFEPCESCHRRPDHHHPACPNSQSEAVRREALVRHGIDPVIFGIFLRALAKEYK